MFKKLFFLLLLFTACTGCEFAVTEPTINEPVPKTDKVTVKKVHIFPDELLLYAGEKDMLKATVEYADGTIDHQVKWHSNDEGTFTVDQNGEIFAISSGEAEIIASSSIDPAYQAVAKVKTKAREPLKFIPYKEHSQKFQAALNNNGKFAVSWLEVKDAQLKFTLNIYDQYSNLVNEPYYIEIGKTEKPNYEAIKDIDGKLAINEKGNIVIIWRLYNKLYFKFYDPLQKYSSKIVNISTLLNPQNQNFALKINEDDTIIIAWEEATIQNEEAGVIFSQTFYKNGNQKSSKIKIGNNNSKQPQINLASSFVNHRHSWR